MRKRLTPGVVLGIIAVGFAMSGSAVAGSLITSAKIKDGTIRNKDIKKGTIALNRLTPAAQSAIRRTTQAGARGATGATGTAGAPGAPGAAGADGTSVLPSPTVVPTSGNWGVINRNTIGSPAASLRSGPANPALGDGSLNLSVGTPDEKIAFGNEVDSVAGGLFANIQQVGFRVYTTGRTRPRAVPHRTCRGSPSRSIPTSTATPASNYSSLVWMPENSASNPWSPYIDATTSRPLGRHRRRVHRDPVPTSTASRCTFAELQDHLDDGGDPATILTVAVGKGRDFAWSGSVDGLRINDTVFDFEERGVFTTAP